MYTSPNIFAPPPLKFDKKRQGNNPEVSELKRKLKFQPWKGLEGVGHVKTCRVTSL